MKTCRAWLSIHSPQYRSRRSSRTPSGTVTPQASSIAAIELTW
jgi:hypothetical protein